MIRIIHYREKCIGCNACVEVADFRWRISRKDGKCTLVGGAEKKGIYMALVDNDEEEANRLAAANCPVKIIKIEQV